MLLSNYIKLKYNDTHKGNAFYKIYTTQYISYKF